MCFKQAKSALGNLQAVISPFAFSQACNEDLWFVDVLALVNLSQKQDSKGKLVPILFDIHGGDFSER